MIIALLAPYQASTSHCLSCICSLGLTSLGDDGCTCAHCRMLRAIACRMITRNLGAVRATMARTLLPRRNKLCSWCTPDKIEEIKVRLPICSWIDCSAANDSYRRQDHHAEQKLAWPSHVDGEYPARSAARSHDVQLSGGGDIY